MNPKKLILIDGIGALVSAFMLSVVLVSYQKNIGMPLGVLYLLALFPILFMFYDLVCYFGVQSDLRIFLKIIAMANLAYCGISIAYLIYHFHQLTVLGLGYFIAEVVIVMLLASLEWKVASRL